MAEEIEFQRLYKGGSKSLTIIALAVIAFAIFLFVVAVFNPDLPFWVYLAVPLILLIIIILTMHFGSVKKGEEKTAVSGKGKIKTAIIGILMVVIAWIFVYGMSFLGSPDRIYYPEDQREVNLENDFDFGIIEIVFAEMPKEGSTVDFDIGPYEAQVNINTCVYHSDRKCYLGSWRYFGPSTTTNVGTEEIEVFYDKESIKSLKIFKVGSMYGTILVGNSPIKGLDQSEPELNGEKKISCSGCKIEEVKVYYNFIARIKNLIGLG